MNSGGSQYGASPGMTFFSGDGGGGGIGIGGEAVQINSFPSMARSEGFTDEDSLAAAGEEAERSFAAGNRWPRQETLALLKIRSDMDAAFRDATLKGPLWEQVSRKLAEMGYQRSAKKCKEKFENVHKYYKRTKDGRAGRQDGKTYRFFFQLEALQNPAATSSSAAAAAAANFSQLPPLPPASPLNSTPPTGLSFSSDAFSSSASESEEDDETEATPVGAPHRRKRSRGERMMAFFEGLMKQVMERQEKMQQRFLEAIERREQERTTREEAWRRQEMARAQKEQELIIKERALAASRDASIVAFLQKMTGTAAAAAVPPPPPPPQEVNASTDSSSSRWPRAEVQALIKLRMGLEEKYREAGPKGPLWEEIAAEMRKIGYARTPKRCKEKWENINKYFKKVKESNKKRPEDSKTCPYFHLLDALYREKLSQSGGGAAGDLSPALFHENGGGGSSEKMTP
ncbi:trihelix transcription factor DF1-like isoform X2 [Wolffia australiana]